MAKKPWLLIPETACIAALSPIQTQAMRRIGRDLVVAITGDGLASNVDQSESSGPISSDAHRQFLEAFGLLDQVSWEHSDDCETHDKLLVGLWNIISTAPLRFILPVKSKSNSVYPWKNMLKLSAVLSFCYLLLTSVYLWSASVLADYRISTLTEEAEKTFDIRRDIKILKDDFTEIDATLSGVKPMWVAWDIALDLAEMGVSLRQSVSENGAVTFFVAAPKATEILSFLSKDPRIASADYAFPVRQVENEQQFAVKVTFADGWAEPELGVNRIDVVGDE
jgi:hypothetical protein